VVLCADYIVRQEICSVKPGVFVQPTLRSSSSVEYPYMPRTSRRGHKPHRPHVIDGEQDSGPMRDQRTAQPVGAGKTQSVEQKSENARQLMERVEVQEEEQDHPFCSSRGFAFLSA
jgi:hypothetical protein